MRRVGILLVGVDLGCAPTEEPVPPEGPGVPDEVPTDVTFYAFGDPQYGGGADDKNTFHVAALNAFAGAPPGPGTCRVGASRWRMCVGSSSPAT